MSNITSMVERRVKQIADQAERERIADLARKIAQKRKDDARPG